MKQKLLFLTAMMVGVTLYGAREWEQFLQANQSFEQEKFDEALNDYETITHKGPVVWYNIGLCYLKKKNNLDAFISFKRAAHLADRTLLKTIAPHITYLEKELSLPQTSTFTLYAEWCRASLSLFWLQILLLLVVWAYALSWYMQHACSVGLRVALFGVIGTLILLIGILLWEQSCTVAIATREAALLVGPNDSFHSVGEIFPGQHVSVVTCKNAWCKIKGLQGFGWVHSDNLAQLELQE